MALAKARELGYEVVACASTGNLANAVAAHAAAAGLESYVFIPSDLEEQKILATGVYGTNLVAVKRQLRRREPALPGAGRRARLGVREREHEALLRRGLEDASPTRWPSSSAGSCPTAWSAPIASGSLFTKIARGFEEWREVGLLEGDLPVFNGAQAEGCSPVARRGRRGATSASPGGPSTIAKSLAIGNPADGPYALDLAGAPSGGIDSVTDDEIRAGIQLLAETTGVFTETAGGVTTAVLKKLADRGDIDARRARRAGDHRRGPEDARRGARQLRDARDRARTVAFDSRASTSSRRAVAAACRLPAR